MKVWVCGGGGWIGRYCLEILKERGHRVEAYGDVLLYLSWVTTPGEFWESPKNIDHFRLANQTFSDFDGKKIVFAGTGANDTTLYGRTKDAVRKVLDAYSDIGYKTTYAKIYYPYGPHEKLERLVPSIIRALKNNEEYTINKSAQVVSCTHVKDVARALVKMVEEDAPKVTSIGGDVCTLGMIGNIIGEIMGKPELIKHGFGVEQAYRPGLGEVFPCDQEFTLHEGLRDTVEFWL